MHDTPDIIIVNKPGVIRLGNVTMTITKEQIRISPDQQAIQQYQQPSPIVQQQQPIQPMQPGVTQPENQADRIRKSTLKTVDFLNRFFWG